MTQRGLLLMAHGARDPRWADPFEAVAHRIRELEPGVPVQLAFLEFMTPTMREAGDLLVAFGCTQVDVLPLFLGAGGHVRRDLPHLLEELAQANPTVGWRMLPAIGEMDAVVEAMARAAVSP